MAALPRRRVLHATGCWMNFGGDAVPEKAPSTRVNRAATIGMPNKKKVAIYATTQLLQFSRGTLEEYSI